MQQIVSKEYKPLFIKPNNIRYVILMGGRGAGRSTVVSQYIIARLMSPDYFRAAIMRFVLGDIRNSIYQEIKDRAEEQGIEAHIEINGQPMRIEYGANAVNSVGFRKSSSDQKAKLKSLASFNTVAIEEADETPEADFMQLDDSLRTVKGDIPITIILTLNSPARSHWIIKRFFDLVPAPEAPGFYIPQLKPEVQHNTIYIRTDYTHNIRNLHPQTIQNYEQYRFSKPDHYWNMIKGYVPETVRGRIYSNWKVIDEIPHEAQLVRRYVDYGYTNDPTGS